MILDNADDAEIMYGSGPLLRLADYLPRSDQGSILLTTRFQRVGANFTSPQNIFKLQSMTLKESELLLRARLGENSPEPNRDTYQELAKELEYTPLALVQAASYMSQNCMTIATYLQLYRQSDVTKIRLLSEDFEDDVRDCQAKNPIATTWIISFDYINMHVPQAAELLSLMSVMDAQAIPEFLMPQGEDAISFNKAVGTLEAFSFISTRSPSFGSLQHYRLFDLHRLVRLAIRNWLKMNHNLGQKTAQALTVLGFDCLQEDCMKFEMSSLILPHAIEVLASDQLPSMSLLSRLSENADLPSLSDLRYLSTTPTGEMGEPSHILGDAESMSHHLIHISELLDYVVYHFVAAGNHKKARIFAAKSLIVATRACGQSHIKTLYSMYTLASILQDLGDYELAEQLRRQYVTVCMAEYGSHHILTLQDLLYLRNFLEEEKEQEAKEIGEYALQQCKESLLLQGGKEYLKILSLLAEFNQYNSDFEEVEKCQRLALHGYKAINVIATLRSLSRTYERQDKWGLAGDTKKLELDTCISCHGQNHPVTMHTRLGLTYVLLKDKKKEEARQLASSALELTSQVFGPSSDTYTHHCSEFDRLFEISSRQEQLLSSLENASTAQMASPMPETNEIVVNVLESHIPQQMQIT